MATLEAAVKDLLSAGAGYTDGDGLRLFRLACAAGRLDLAQALQHRFRFGGTQARYAPVIGDVEQPPALLAACAGGHVGVAQWLVDVFGFDARDVTGRDGEALVGACEGGHLDAARWYIEDFNLGAANAAVRNFGAFRESCAAGQLEVAQWLARTFKMTAAQAMAGDSDAFIRACGSPRALQVASWLLESFDLTSNYVAAQGYRALTEAGKSGRAVVELVARHAGDISSPAFVSAAFEGMKEAVKARDEAALEYLGRFPKLDNGELAELVETGFASGQDFVMEQYYSRLRLDEYAKAAILQRSLAAAIANGQTAIVEKYRYRISLGAAIREPLLAACRRGFFEVVRLLRLDLPDADAGVVAAAEGGNPETVRLFLRQAGEAAVQEAFAAALLRDNFEAAEAIYASGRAVHLPRDDRAAYVALCEQGDLAFLRWLVRTLGARGELIRDHAAFVRPSAPGGLAASYRPQDSRVFAILETASTRDHIDIVEWLNAELRQNDIYPMAWEEFFRATVRAGRVTMSEFWYRVGRARDKTARGEPARARQPEVVRRATFQAQRGFILETIPSACARGELDIVRWLISRFGVTPRDLAPALDKAVAGAARGGHLDAVRFLLTEEAPREASRDLERLAMREAFLSNQASVVMWVGERAAFPEAEFPVTPAEMQSTGHLVRDWYAAAYGKQLTASQFKE
jgi:hypothetical protein